LPIRYIAACPLRDEYGVSARGLGVELTAYTHMCHGNVEMRVE
jgi:hypothetical protein